MRSRFNHPLPRPPRRCSSGDRPPLSSALLPVASAPRRICVPASPPLRHPRRDFFHLRRRRRFRRLCPFRCPSADSAALLPPPPAPGSAFNGPSADSRPSFPSAGPLDPAVSSRPLPLPAQLPVPRVHSPRASPSHDPPIYGAERHFPHPERSRRRGVPPRFRSPPQSQSPLPLRRVSASHRSFALRLSFRLPPPHPARRAAARRLPLPRHRAPPPFSRLPRSVRPSSHALFSEPACFSSLFPRPKHFCRSLQYR